MVPAVGEENPTQSQAQDRTSDVNLVHRESGTPRTNLLRS
jgi:hypothetical protein